MKRIKLFFGIALIGLLGAGIFTSCEEDETFPLPTITFTNDVDTVKLEAGDSTHTITGTVTAEGDLNYVKYFKVTDQGENQVDMVEEFNNPQNYNFSYTVTGIGQDMTIKVEATDEENQTVSRNFNIYFTPPEPSGDSINSYLDVTIGSISWNTTDPTYYAVATNTTYAHDDDDAYKSDLGYIYGDNHEATICSPGWDELDTPSQGPDESGWNSEKATRFKTTSLTPSDFDAIAEDFDSEFVIEDNATDASNEFVDHLQVGGKNEDVDVIAFITENDKKGLIKINSIEDGSNDDHPGGSGTITFDVKIQK